MENSTANRSEYSNIPFQDLYRNQLVARLAVAKSTPPVDALQDSVAVPQSKVEINHPLKTRHLPGQCHLPYLKKKKEIVNISQ